MGLICYFNGTNANSVMAFTTLRQTGVSGSTYHSMNLANHVGDNPEHVMQNRKMLATNLGIRVDQLIFPEQTHTSNIKVIEDEFIDADELLKTDALITNQKSICLCILTADCVPILIYDPHKKAIAAIHAGWKGTVEDIAVKTIHQMKTHFKCNPKHLLVSMGPCISQNAYEVGYDVFQAFHAIDLTHDQIFIPSASQNKFNLDLIKANRHLLIRAGIQESHIETTGSCTFYNSDLFFSARREGLKSGRMASGIMLK